MFDTKECCVCYEATEHSTPCNHLVCESCYSQIPTCPMCRAPLERPVEEDSSDESDDDDDDDDYETIPATLINAACLGNEETAQLALD